MDEPATAPMVVPVKVPALQVIVVNPLGFATTKPPGRLSPVAAGKNCTSVSTVEVLGLLIVKVRAVEVPVKIGFAVNALLMIGGSTTVSEEVPIPLEVRLGPLSVDEMLLLTFVCDPAALPRIFTEILQMAFADNVPPLTAMVEVPAVAVTVEPVKVPVEQDCAKPFGVAINSPVGSTSVNETPGKAVVFGFVSVNVNALVLPVEIVLGEKLLERLGTVGRAQPVNVTSSMRTSALEF